VSRTSPARAADAARLRSTIRPAQVLALAERTLSRPAAPYREGAVIAWIRDFAAARPELSLREDPSGNLELRRHGMRASRTPLVLAAHMDHPGFRVRRCTRSRDGFRIDAWFLGGVRPEYFPGARARFFAPREGDAAGEIGNVLARVVSVQPDRRRGELRVRLSARAPVPPGAFGTWALTPFRRDGRRPDLLVTRAAGVLAGVTAILALFDAIDRVDPNRRVDVRGCFTRAEEVGFVGALAVARGRWFPRDARIVAIEASKALPHAPQGGGPILRVGDRTSVFDDGLTRWIARVGASLAGPKGTRFTWQRRLMDGGTCESTAYQLHGYRCAAMCLPLGNYHNMSDRGASPRIAAETIRLSDLVGLVRFFEGMVRRDDDCPRRGGADPLRVRLDQRFRAAARELRRDPFA
jgi:endoglucanase